MTLFEVNIHLIIFRWHQKRAGSRPDSHLVGHQRSLPGQAPGHLPPSPGRVSSLGLFTHSCLHEESLCVHSQDGCCSSWRVLVCSLTGQLLFFMESPCVLTHRTAVVVSESAESPGWMIFTPEKNTSRQNLQGALLSKLMDHIHI